jgi:hypothetical protein
MNEEVSQIGLKEAYPSTTTPLPWMSGIMDLKKEKNSLRRGLLSIRLVGRCAGIDGLAFYSC